VEGKKHGNHFRTIQHTLALPVGTVIHGQYRHNKSWNGMFIEQGCEPAEFFATYINGIPLQSHRIVLNALNMIFSTYSRIKQFQFTMSMFLNEFFRNG
jgi:hypothetical protein